MKKYHNPYNKSVYRSFALVMQFGINMVVPIGMMTALGIWLDRKFDTSFWVVVLFFAGAAAGAQNIYRMARQIYAAPEEGTTNSRQNGKSKPDRTEENDRITEKKK